MWMLLQRSPILITLHNQLCNQMNIIMYVFKVWNITHYVTRWIVLLCMYSSKENPSHKTTSNGNNSLLVCPGNDAIGSITPCQTLKSANIGQLVQHLFCQKQAHKVYSKLRKPWSRHLWCGIYWRTFKRDISSGWSGLIKKNRSQFIEDLWTLKLIIRVW